VTGDLFDSCNLPLSNKEATEEISTPKVLIAYGSETGTAEAAAESLARRLKVCKPSVYCLNDVSTKGLLTSRREKYSHVLIICSTFGAGEPPSNANLFFEENLEGSLSSDTKYAVLALGSSLYPDFCKAGKDIDQQLSFSRATPMIDVTCVDATKGAQDTILKWSNNVRKQVLPDALVKQIKAGNGSSGNDATLTSYRMRWQKDTKRKQKKNLSATPTGSMTCLQNRELIKGGDIMERSTRHIDLKLPQGCRYKTGDHLSVTPLNNMSTVARFCSCFAYELEKAATRYGYNQMSSITKSLSKNIEFSESISWLSQIPFNIECFENGQSFPYPSQSLKNKTLIEVIQSIDLSFHQESYVLDLMFMLMNKLSAVDVSTPSARTFEKLFSQATSNYIVNQENINFNRITAQFPTIVHFMKHFKGLFCEPVQGSETPLISIVDLLVLMPRLKPRFYSISSSKIRSPSAVSITVGVVNKQTPAGQIQGICSHYLANLRPGEKVKAEVGSSSFHAPVLKKHPVIMIGNGTGCAPLMGLLEDRALMMKTSRNRFNECHYFFGCRNDREVLYHDKLREWEYSGVATLHIAQSRQRDLPKQYVQDLLRDSEEFLASLLLHKDGTHIYICGDARMAKSCTDTFVSVLQKFGKMSNISALRYITQLRMKNRLKLDVWGNSAVEETNSGYNVKKSKNFRRASQEAWRSSLIMEPAMDSPMTKEIPPNMMATTKLAVAEKSHSGFHLMSSSKAVSFTKSEKRSMKNVEIPKTAGLTKPAFKTSRTTSLRSLRREDSSRKMPAVNNKINTTAAASSTAAASVRSMARSKSTSSVLSKQRSMKSIDTKTPATTRLKILLSSKPLRNLVGENSFKGTSTTIKKPKATSKAVWT